MATRRHNPIHYINSHRDKWLLAGLLLLAGIVFRDLFFWDAVPHRQPNTVGWFFDISDTAPHLHVLLVLGLFYWRRSDIFAAFKGQGSPGPALLFLLPAAALYAWGLYVNAMDLVYAAFILTGLGTAQLLSGRRLAGLLLIPALILALAIPLPAVLINQMVFPLQLWTAEHSVWLLRLLGITALQLGNVIDLGGHGVRVAESCTALGFIKWLLVFALAYIYMFPVSRLHAFLLVLAAPFIAYAVNLSRAFSLILNPGMEVLTIHTLQGVVFFMAGFFLLYVLDSLLLRVLGDSAGHAAMQDTLQEETAVVSKRGPILVLTALFSGLLLTSIFLPRWSVPSDEPAAETLFPDEIKGWQEVNTLKLSYLFLGSTRYSDYSYRVYRKGRDWVSLFIGADNRQRRFRSALSAKNAYQGYIGQLREQRQVELGDNQWVESVLSEYDGSSFLAYSWYEGTAGMSEEVLRALLALDQSPLRRPGVARVFRIATPVAPTPTGYANAEQRLRQFLQAL